eukprot:gene24190-56906_t
MVAGVDPDTGLRYGGEVCGPALRDPFRPMFRPDSGGSAIYFFALVLKQGHRTGQSPQKRVLIVADRAMYVTDLHSSVHRCVLLADVDAVYVGANRWLRWVGVSVPKQYDMLFQVTE